MHNHLDKRYPLHWPRDQPRTPAHERKTARYGKREGHSLKKLSIAEAIKRLKSEVEMWTKAGHPWRINPEKVVISSNLELRNDGFLRSSQKEPKDPGVAVYFRLDGKDACIPCDTFDRTADNIAAVAEWLKCQRGAERTGCGSTSATFRGYAALPESKALDLWWAVMGFSGAPAIDQFKTRYRELVKIRHPDKGGNRSAWDSLQQAYQEGMKYYEEES